MLTRLHTNKKEGEFVPRHRDSALKAVRPESSFLDFFKQSLIYTSPYCTESGCCSFFDDDDVLGSEDDGQDQGNPEVAYPLSLFEDLNYSPPISTLQHFSHVFQSKFLGSVPFLAELPCMALDIKDMPFFLLLPRALLGAAISGDLSDEATVESLWQASSSLVTGTIEVDNSLGRTMVWHAAVKRLHIPCFYSSALSLNPGRPDARFLGRPHRDLRSNAIFWEHLELFRNQQWSASVGEEPGLSQLI